MKKLLGFDIGGTKCAVVLGDGSGNVFKKIRFETTDYETSLQALLAAGEELFEEDVVALTILPAKLGDALGDKAALSVAYNGYCERGDKA